MKSILLLFTLAIINPSAALAGPLNDELETYLSKQKETKKEQSKEAHFYYCALQKSVPVLVDIFKELSAAEDLIYYYKTEGKSIDTLKNKAVDLRKEYNAFRACRENLYNKYDESRKNHGIFTHSTVCNKGFRIACAGKEYILRK